MIGQQKFADDLWGDVVTTASRLESHGLSGAVQMTTCDLRAGRRHFACECRGVVKVTGKGTTEVWLCRATGPD